MTTPSLAFIDDRILSARASGALHVIETQQAYIEEAGITFLVRWASTLAAKDAARTSHTIADTNNDQRTLPANPFLPPEAALTLGTAGGTHLLVLNKFPVIERHLLIVTREFEDQRAPLVVADFAALAGLLGSLGGLGFYNGGCEAGASQRHKHLQWIPESPQSDCLRRLTVGLEVSDVPPMRATRHPKLGWRHSFVRLDASTRSAESLHAAFATACRHCGLDAAASPMQPYNLLLNTDWMLVLPRRREDFEGISINALGFAGSLFVRHPDQIARIREVGPLTVLAAVACS